MLPTKITYIFKKKITLQNLHLVGRRRWKGELQCCTISKPLRSWSRRCSTLMCSSPSSSVSVCWDLDLRAKTDGAVPVHASHILAISTGALPRRRQQRHQQQWYPGICCSLATPAANKKRNRSGESYSSHGQAVAAYA
jgi:hypothetical protein